MKRTTIAAALCLALAAGAAFGQDEGAETRFHRAYEQEVVEGKLADAARVYLEMMRDEKVPERLRSESKFRFAVTAVLLGRADEARALLDELVRDPNAPETLRARAKEYLDAAKGIGVGSELDRKMQSLVFDLAKDKEITPAAYRDFEVIGKRAVPFLRQLLVHDDRALRTHAFRMLLGMKEPGMAEAWTPDLTWSNSSAQSAFSRYLVERPDERAVFERKVLALGDEVLVATLEKQRSLRTPLSAETLRAFAARHVPAKTLVSCLPAATAEETERLRGEWITGADADLSTEATLSYLRAVQTLPAGSVEFRTDLFPAIVERLAARRNNWHLTSGAFADAAERPAAEGFVRLGAAVPLDTLLDTIAALVERGTKAPTEPADASNPLKSGLLDALATAVEEKVEPSAALPPRYADMLKAWFVEAAKRSMLETVVLQAHAARGIRRLPREAAEGFAVWVVTTPFPAFDARSVAEAIPVNQAAHVPVALAAIRAAGPDVRTIIAANLGLGNAAITLDTEPESARVIAPQMAAIVRLWTATSPSSYPPIETIAVYLEALPAEEAQACFADIVEALLTMPAGGSRNQALTVHLLGTATKPPKTAYWRDVAIPGLDRVWTKLEANERQQFLTKIVWFLAQEPSDPGLRAAVGRFVSARYGEVPSWAAAAIAQAPDVFPLIEWVPHVCPNDGVTDNQAIVPSVRADPAAREMTKEPAALNAAILVFVAKSASVEVRREVFDRLLRTVAVERIGFVLSYAGSASVDALEETLARSMEAPRPDVRVIASLVARVRAARPSDKLFPAIRLLLANGTGGSLTSGIEAAKALGREELLPDLGKLLDSMDEKVRQDAKGAIDSIVELRKLKEETRRRADGK